MSLSCLSFRRISLSLSGKTLILFTMGTYIRDESDAFDFSTFIFDSDFSENMVLSSAVLFHALIEASSSFEFRYLSTVPSNVFSCSEMVAFYISRLETCFLVRFKSRSSW